MPNEFFPPIGGEKACMFGKLKMARKIVITIIWIAWLLDAGFITDSAMAASDVDGVYLAQKAAAPQRTSPPSSEAGTPSFQEKAQEEKGKEQKPAAPLKSSPPKPFEPTEKVKADQAIDFPADI
jgi:hypothetical protein